MGDTDESNTGNIPPEGPWDTIPLPPMLLTVETVLPQNEVILEPSAASADLEKFVDESIERIYADWSSVMPVSLDNISFKAADLPGNTLALTIDKQITIDEDAAGFGWFIDPTPGDNSEFKQTEHSWELVGLQGDAAERIDLFTVIAHELGHVFGLADVSPSIDPTRLMTGTLPIGVRRLPSALDLTQTIEIGSTAFPALEAEDWTSVLDTFTSSSIAAFGSANPLNGPLQPELDPHVGLLNGDFSIGDSANTAFAWDVRGDTAVVSGATVLQENDCVFSGLTQTFIIPEGAQTLCFTIVSAIFGDNGADPPDAFEVALLDATTMMPLVGTLDGFTNTDALLNIQQDGHVYYAASVTVPGASGSGSILSVRGSRTVSIDITGIAADTVATLYFDLLGFGPHDSSITIDNVILSETFAMAPVVDAGYDQTIDEGNFFSSGGSFKDSDTGDTWAATVDYGDGSGVQALALTGTTFQFSHFYASEGGFPVMVTVTDAYGLIGSDTVVVTVQNVTPLAQDDIYNLDEDTVLAVDATNGLLSNDTDAGMDQMTTVLAAGPAHGTLSVQKDGSFTYTPELNYNGTDSFTYNAGDGSGNSNVATVTLTISPVNDKPSAMDDSFYVDEGALLRVNVLNLLLNDSDADGDILNAVLVDAPVNGNVSLNADGSFIYSPNAGFSGTDSFTYTANDGPDDSNLATVTITIKPAVSENHPPVAQHDAYRTEEDTPLTIAAAVGLLANDSDPNGDPLTAALVDGPAHGTLELNPDGSFTYTPDLNSNGTDSFTYMANDGQADSNITTVSLTITPVSDAPVAFPDAASTMEDTPLTILAASLLGNDTDVDGDTLAVVGVGNAVNGAVTLDGSGNALFTPDLNFNGAASFDYTVSDGEGDFATSTVTITVTPVNDAPVAVDDSYATDEDTTITISTPGVLSNDSDVERDSLTAVMVSGPAHGTLGLNADGNFTYAPAANFNGTDSFTYRASDGTVDSNEATVTLTITPVNDAPVAANDAYTTFEDTLLSVASPGLFANDSDIESGLLTAAVVAGPTHGTLGLTADGSFTYTPEKDFFGEDSFTYQVNDGQDDTNVATATLTIAPVNDAPVAVGDSYTTDEDTTLTILGPGLLGNDSDVESDPLTVSLVDAPLHGTISLNADGSFTYATNENYFGPDSFTYRAYDGTDYSNIAAVALTINAVNDIPVAESAVFNTAEDTPLSASVVAADADGDPLTFSVAPDGSPAHGSLALSPDGSFTYTPDKDFFGTDSFAFTANDGAVDSAPATVAITIDPVNDAPVAVHDAYSTTEDTPLVVTAPGLLANDSDVERDPLSAVLVTGPSHGILALASDGSFTYTPTLNFSGTEVFSYQVNDGTANSNVATVNLIITPVNDAPLALDDALTTAEDTPLTIPAVMLLANDLDVDGDQLTLASVGDATHGTVYLDVEANPVFTPDLNFYGAAGFTYTLADGQGGSSTAAVAITVTSVNDAPVACDDAYTTPEDTPLVISAPGLLTNDTDVDSVGLMAVHASQPQHGTVTLNADGAFTYTPVSNFSGQDAFTYRVNDGTAESDVATVAITVTAEANQTPVAQADVYTTDEDTSLTIAVVGGLLANDTDPNGDPLSAILVDGPAHGTLALNADGGFTYTPGLDFNGTDSFTYRVSDGSLTSDPASVTLTITPVNDAPLALDDSYATDEDAALTIAASGLLGNDSDVENDPLGVTLVAGPANGSVVLNPDGAFTYTPSLNFNGRDSFTYRATDGLADSGMAVVHITVRSINDAPVAGDEAYATAEDTPLVIAAPGLLATDTDVEGDLMTTVLVNGPEHGALTLNSDGSFTYTPDLNFNGIDSFSYQAKDGQTDSNVAMVTLTINPVNDAPLAQDDTFTTAEDVTLTVTPNGVLANDTDVEGDSLTGVLVSGPKHGSLTLNADGSFTYTPDLNFNGSDSFTYKANDGFADSNVATVAISITSVNDVSVAQGAAFNTAEDTPLSASVAATDVDGDPLTFSVAQDGSPAHGSLALSPDGSFTYNPDKDFFGTYSFAFIANDGAVDSAPAIVTIIINPVNDGPIAKNDEYTTTEDTLLTVAAPGLLGNDTDVESDPLTVVLASGPLHGNLTLSSDGSFNYSPEKDFFGADSFTYLATDGLAGSNVATVSLAVTPVNDAPVADILCDARTVDEGSTLTFIGAISDPDDRADSISSLWDFGDGSTATGTLTPTHTYLDGGVFKVTFTVMDHDGAVGTDALIVTVNNVAPVANAGEPYTMDEGSSLTLAGYGSDAGPMDAAALVYTWDLNRDGVFGDATGATPTLSWAELSSLGLKDSGSYAITLRVADDDTWTNAATTVTIYNLAPTVTADVSSQQAQYSDPIPNSVTFTATDPVDAMSAAVSYSFNGGAFTAGLPDASSIAGGLSFAGAANQSTPATWVLSGIADLQPGTYVLRMTVTDDDGGAAYSDTTLVVDREDACNTYAGPMFVSTPSIKISVATVELRAVIRDITAVTPGTDPDAGNITKATVTFINRDTNAVIAANVPVSLIDPADPKTGAAVFNWRVDLGSKDSDCLTVGIVVNGFYGRNASAEDTVVTVSKPLDNFITGGGYLVNTASAGAFAGDPGFKTNFGFNVKFNKQLTNLQGKFTAIVRDGDRVYQIKTNATDSLVVGQAANKAAFVSKANLIDITDPTNPVSIAGNLSLIVTLTDRGEPGSADAIGFTLWKGSELLFSSNWSGTGTIEQLLSGGNLVVHAGVAPKATSAVACVRAESKDLSPKPRQPIGYEATYLGTTPAIGAGRIGMDTAEFKIPDSAGNELGGVFAATEWMDFKATGDGHGYKGHNGFRGHDFFGDHKDDQREAGSAHHLLIDWTCEPAKSHQRHEVKLHPSSCWVKAFVCDVETRDPNQGIQIALPPAGEPQVAPGRSRNR
jgi:VCBS repeat-containing protein